MPKKTVTTEAVRDEAAIVADIAEATAAARAMDEGNSVTEHFSATRRVKALQAELSAHLADGAVPCAKCGSQPHGMLKRPEFGPFYGDDNEIKTPYSPAIYAVGCTACGFLGQTLGPTPEATVERWNKAHG